MAIRILIGIADLKAKVAKEGESDSRGLECLSPSLGRSKDERDTVLPVAAVLSPQSRSEP